MKSLYNYISDFYQTDEFPALSEQLDFWSKTRPFEGIKILDATPVFRNTLVKYLALLTGGADLTVAIGEKIPADLTIFNMLPEFGICQATAENIKEHYDVIADCAGSFHTLTPRTGFVELTRSGLEYYKNSQFPVFSADSGLIKKLETVAGTGNGFVRALKKSGFGELAGKKILLFGCGKVGYGIASAALQEGCRVTIVDRTMRPIPAGADFTDASERQTVKKAINDAWCIVSATGIADALADHALDFNNSSAIIVNMGVEDEFGPALPQQRVLNNKRPFNFILEEPTLIRYIDATMALNNYGIEILLNSKLPSGISLPPEKLENKIIATILKAGLITNDVEEIVKLHNILGV